jgi:hypothetical protein
MSANAYVLKEIFNKLDAIGIHQGLILSKLEKLEGKSLEEKGKEWQDRFPNSAEHSPWALKKKEAENQLKERIVKQQIEAIQSEKVSKPEILGVSIEDFGKYLQEMNEEKAIEISDELFTKISKK